MLKLTERGNLIAEPATLFRVFWDDISREFRNAGHAEADT